MMNDIDHIVEHLFHKKSLAEVSEFELERFIATYPYFAAGHFLLARKTQISHPEKSREKIGTTSLYYNNALWLQWLINQDHGNLNKSQEIDSDLITSIPHNKTQAESESSGIINEREDLTEPEYENSVNSPGSEIYNQPSTSEFEDTSSPVENFSSTEGEARIIDDEAYEFFGAPIGDQPEQANEIGGQSPLSEETDTIADDESDRTSQDHLSEFSKEQEETVADEDSTTHPSPSKSEYEYGNEEVLPLQDDEVEHEHESDLNSEKSRATAAGIERTLSNTPLIPTKAANEKNEFTFEPYHTIDYFASQGIKLQQSDLSKDKFGKQLKSFTEWLRSMKRLPQPAIDSNLDEATQKSIQNIAEHSFEEKDIVTETMAEVWIKQGNKEKAIDTLEKLSLLDPSKSHYFAAKIEQLKAS